MSALRRPRTAPSRETRKRRKRALQRRTGAPDRVSFTVDDLAQLANHAGIELSPFIREAIIADLLGRGSLPERPEMFASGTPEAIAWERHEAVPVTMMDAADYDGLGVLDPEWIATPPHTPG